DNNVACVPAVPHHAAWSNRLIGIETDVLPVAVHHVVGDQLRVQTNLIRRLHLISIEVEEQVWHCVEAVQIRHCCLRQLVEQSEVDTFSCPGTDDEWFNGNPRLNLAKGVNIRAAEVHDRCRVVE